VDVAGIGDGNPEDVAVDLVRDRRAALQHVQRHELRRLGVDRDHPEVEQRQLVPGRERARDAVGAGGALVDERLRERAGSARAATRERKLVRGEQAGRREQVREQLCLLVDRLALGRRQPGGGLGRGVVARARGNSECEVVAHIPRSRYRQKEVGT
jgi:hypothetical protein